MATLAEYLRQIGGQINTGMQGLRPALEQGFSNPLTHAGLGIMMGSQAGGPGAAQGFMQGMQGYNQYAAQQAQAADQKAMRELQAAQLARLQAGDKREDATRAAVMQALKNNPGMLGDMPLARTVLEATGDPSQLQGLSGLMPKQPAPMSEYQQGMLDVHRRRVEKQGQLTPYQQAQITRWERQQNGMTPYQQAQVGQWEAENARKDAEAKRAEAMSRQKTMGTVNDLDAKYQGATAELDKLSEKLNQFTQMPGFGTVYGRGGKQAEQLVEKTGTLLAPDVANALTMRDEIMAMGGLSRLMDLKGSGVSLGQVTEAEHKLLQQSFANLRGAQTGEAAAQRIKELMENVNAVKQRITQAYQADRGLYDAPQGMQQAPVRVNSAAERDALPPGTTYVAPDGSVRVKK